MRNNSGTRTRSAPKRATAASQVSRALDHVGDQDGIERARYRVEILEDGKPDELRCIAPPLHDADDLDPMLHRAERRDFREVGSVRRATPFDAAGLGRAEQLEQSDLAWRKKLKE